MRGRKCATGTSPELLVIFIESIIFQQSVSSYRSMSVRLLVSRVGETKRKVADEGEDARPAVFVWNVAYLWFKNGCHR